MCDFCSKDVYGNISDEDDWTILLNSYWNGYYIDIDHEVNLGNFGTQKKSTSFKVNYCPICGRKLED